MKKTSLLASLLAATAACGGGSSTQPAAQLPGDDPGVAAGEPAPGGAADPQLEARKAYVSPGGMWMPRQIATLAPTLKELGLAIDPGQLSDPLSPVLGSMVSLGHCSASFVSPQGLVVTNHHCVQGALAFNSDEKNNLVENGFLARSLGEEKPAGPTQHLFVTQAVKDVTQDILGGLDAIKDPIKRKGEILAREKKLVAACEKGRPGIRCKTYSFFRDAEWQLIESFEIKDVRLVYVPHRGIGNYGGEIDNWAWPRHTGDFSFFRAYVGKDGTPAEYSPDNVPFQPKHVLKLQPRGAAAHDLVFVAGYPARTHRVETAAETRRSVEWTHPRYIAIAQQKMAFLADTIKAGGDTAIKASVARQYTQNGLEKYTGVLAGLKGGTLAAKEKVEADFKAWTGKDPARARYAEALAAVDARVATTWTTEPGDTTLKELVGGLEGNAGKNSGSQLLRAAVAIVRVNQERVKPDAQRRTGFQDRDMPDLLGEVKSFTKRYDSTIDRGYLTIAIKVALELPEEQRPWLSTLLGTKKGAAIDDATIAKALDKLYAGTRLADEKLRTELTSKGTLARVKASKDTFLKLALALVPAIDAYEARESALAGDLALIFPTYIEGLLASQDGRIAPDANWSLRISYGTVKGYKPRPDAETYEPFTRVTQISKKNTGKEPFDAPKALLDAIAKGAWGPYAAPDLGEVPVAFLADLDITGGNSGSPVVNARGELVGLAFDGNIEGLASDVLFNGENTRTIIADVRYMLWVMDAVDKADHLVEEMGIKPAL
jgi:hypothetical protein